MTELTYDTTAKTLTNLKRNGNVLTSFTYDTVGRVQTRTDAKGITLGYSYDNLDRLTVTTYPDNKTSTISYSDCCVRMIDSVTERSGLTTFYTYDLLKRMTNVNGPNGSYEYQYDKNGSLKKLIDRNRTPQIETLFDYDSEGRLTKKTYADGKYWTYAYDKAGLLKLFTNARSITKSYAYDNNDNLTSISYSDSTPSVTFTPDDYNRLWKMDDGIGHYEYTYDANNRPRFVDGPWTDDTIEMRYNELGQMKDMIPQGGQPVEYLYDTIGRLTNIKPSDTNFTYGYTDVNPLIQSLTRPNGSITEYQHNDPLKRLTDVISKTSTGQIINSFNYTYNNRDLKGTETIINGEAIDNFVAETTTYTPNNLNQTTATMNPNRTYVYDFDGNLAESYSADGYRLTMTYDAENRMKSAEYTDGNSFVHRTEYTYSGFSLLAEMKKFENGILQSDIRYVRGGFLPVQERDTNNLVTREYSWGLNMGGGIGGLLNLNRGGQNYNYLYDGKGNVMTLIDGDQNISASYAYDPFGKLMKKSGLLDQSYMFSTKEYDPQSGLSYYGYRFYNTSIGKWTARDPIGERGDVNLYRAVGNNPVNRRDPSGLTWLDYDSGSGTLYIHPGTTDTQGPPQAFSAGNNTTSDSNGPWPPGTYDYSYHTPHPESGADGAYGSNGNFVFDVPGRTGMGVHSGRRGPQSRTRGCIRTTDEGTNTLSNLNAADPILSIIVR